MNAGTAAADVSVQYATAQTGLPDEATIGQWVTRALAAAGHDGPASIAVRIVDAEESQRLNREYRDRDRPTNVLSFPSELPVGLPAEFADELGDLVICAPVVIAEAETQGKVASAHWAHMIVHGTLHLAGFDHVDDADAQIMEALETDILGAEGLPDPYGAGI